MMSHSEKAVRILQAWHRVEFFQTFSVPDNEENKIPPINISNKELEAQGDDLLPWLNPKGKKQCHLDPKKRTTYTLYLGLFDKAVLTKIAEDQCRLATLGDIPDEEIEQRLDNEGKSCFAKLDLDENGYPLMDNFSVSTLPWAIGYLLNDTVDNMSLARFDHDSGQLLERISRFRSALPEDGSNPETKGMNADAIAGLIHQLYIWAGLQPKNLALDGKSEDYTFQIAFYQKDAKKKNNDSGSSTEASLKNGKNDGNDEDENNEKEPSQIPILNSFFIRDIERAITAVKKGHPAKCLTQYLGSPRQRHTDLYGDDALSLIADRLSPSHTPEGRWPSNPEHNMSLMQQFAVNTVFKDLKDGGLCSVNGPPGTGKTTLLRDIIAQNLVERAKVLAGLETAGAGLNADGFLIEPLTGFEMVVASSNNAAVENISKELPQMKSLDAAYRACCYFKPVANQAAAKNQKGRLQPINDPNTRAWGMISAVMGAKTKRNKFIQRFFMYDHWKWDPPSDRDPDEDFLSLWQFRNQWKGPSFNQAKQYFSEILKKYNALNEDLMAYEDLCTSFFPEAYQSKIEVIQREQSDLQNAVSETEARLTELTEQRQVLESELAAENLSLEKIRLDKPGFFTRLFNLSGNRQYKNALLEQLGTVENLRRRISEIEKAENSAKQDLKLNKGEQARLADKKNEVKSELDRQLKEVKELGQVFEGSSIPSSNQHISDPAVQRNAFWQARTMNDLRSQVFIAAMQLHEAWLMEAMDISSFRSQMFHINEGVIHDGCSNKNFVDSEASAC